MDPLVVLAIDAAGSACSVAVGRGEAVLAAEQAAIVHGQAEALLPMVDRVVRAAQVSPAGLDLIAVTVGPGSFTGIRAGLAAARGIGLGIGRPVLGVSAFAAAAASLSPGRLCAGGVLLVALESRRAELYVQFFDASGLPQGDPAVLPPGALGERVAGVAGDGPVVIAGDAAERAADALRGRPRLTVAAGSAPRAVGVLRAALARWRRGDRGGEARPLYLHPPAVTRRPPVAAT
ncbi:MAG TPA: tRNA (adenosine(37)-N6)-threonylcarbamoyltransferase complex dimerization subunit type 1 TsaB [Stellaceae bacterium]